MIAQVRDGLEHRGQLYFGESGIIYKVVSIVDGEYRPAVTHGVHLHGEHRIVYTPGKYFRVGENISYPAFAFMNVADAADFTDMLMRQSVWPDYAILSCIAYEWVRLPWYMSVNKVKYPKSLELFWSTRMPFSDWNVPYAGHATSPQTIGLFRFEIEDVI